MKDGSLVYHNEGKKSQCSVNSLKIYMVTDQVYIPFLSLISKLFVQFLQRMKHTPLYVHTTIPYTVFSLTDLFLAQRKVWVMGYGNEVLTL
jgi:hypothetical protein